MSHQQRIFSSLVFQIQITLVTRIRNVFQNFMTKIYSRQITFHDVKRNIFVSCLNVNIVSYKSEFSRTLLQCCGAATFLGGSGCGAGSGSPRYRCRLRLRPNWVGSCSRPKKASPGGSGSMH